MSHPIAALTSAFPRGDARLDIADLAFPKTVREARVLVETVVEDFSGSFVTIGVDARCRAIRDRLESLKPSLEDGRRPHLAAERNVRLLGSFWEPR
jgi:hypothetical protein